MSLVDCFITLLNMSLAASWTILLVLLARLFLGKAPKVFSYALWSVVLFRLVCPVSFESPAALTPVLPDVIPRDIVYAARPEIQSGVAVLDRVVNQSLPAASPAASANPVQILLEVGARLWIAGGLLLLLWSVLSYLRFRRRLAEAVRLEGRVYESDRISTAFVLGFFRPRIYLPTGLGEGERRYILCHEETHIRRGDHWIKAAALLALFLHWFNPLVWLAYRLLCRDMEMSCDEGVMNRLGEGIRRDYSTSLLAISMRQNGLASPLAFGENDVKGRIQNILRYQKPGFWVVLAAVVLVAALIIGLAANPPGTIPLSEQEGIAYHDTIWGESVEVVMPGMETTTFTITDPADVEALSALVSSLEVTYRPVSSNQSENRPWQFSLHYIRPPEVSVGNFTLYFTAGEVWSGLDGLAYGVDDSETSRLIQALEEYQARAGDGQALGGYYVGFSQVAGGEAGPLYSAENNDAGTRLASLLLSGAETPGEVGAAPPAESYLLIQMGSPDTVYYVYESQGRFYMEKAGDYRLELDQAAYDGILEVFREVSESAGAAGSRLSFQQTAGGERLRGFSLESPELAVEVARLLQGEGDAQPRQAQWTPEGAADFLRIEVGDAGNVWYLYREGETIYADDLSSYRAPLSEDAARQVWNLYLGAAVEGVSQSVSRFTTGETTMEGIARDGILGYYGAFEADDLPEEIRMEDFQLQSLTPMAGTLEEFVVSIIYSYETPTTAYWISANGGGAPLEDGGWRWSDCYLQCRFARVGEGEYEITDRGTGGVARGLEPIA